MRMTFSKLGTIALGSFLAVGLSAVTQADDSTYRQYAPKPESGYSSNPHVSQDHTGTYPFWKDRAALDPERVTSEELQWTTNWKFMDPPFDDSLHGGHVALDRGQEVYAQLNGSDHRFARCLGASDGNLKGLRANHYPHFNRELGKVVNLEMMIEHCAAQQGVTLQHGSYDNSAVSVYVASHSNGMPITIDVTQGELKEAFERGQERFHLRTGRMNMACGTCHVTLVGERLRGQALTTHYGDVAHWPTYRTKDELQSLHVRFTECNRNGGTQPLKPGAKPYVDIEVFLTALSNGYGVAVPSARD